MSVEQNVIDAEDAIRYVKQQVRHGASTHAGDMYRTGGANRDRLGQSRAAVEGARRAGADFQTAVTVAAKAVQAGNCGEQSYVAYQYLTAQLNRHTVAVVVLEGWNHQVVVVGAPGLSGVKFMGISAAAAPTRWGSEAVVCDPWLGMSYRVDTDWVTSIATTLRMTLPGRQPPAVGKALVVEYTP